LKGITPLICAAGSSFCIFDLTDLGDISGSQCSVYECVLWVVALYSLVEVYQHFINACCLRHQGLLTPMMDAASASEALVNFCQTTRHYSPEDSHLIYQIWIDSNRKYSSVLFLNCIVRLLLIMPHWVLKCEFQE
jgi:hypothetical protein